MYLSFFRSHKEFVKVTAADLVNRFGDSIDALAFTWLTYDLSKSASMSAFVFAMNLLPTVLFQPLVAPLVEKMRKKPLMVLTDVLRGMCVMLIMGLFLSQNLQAWMMIPFTFLMNTLEAFRIPAGTGFALEILTGEEMEQIMGFKQGSGRTMELLGTAAGGIIVGSFTQWAFLIDGLTFFVSAVLIAFTRVKEEKKEEQSPAVSASFQAYTKSLSDGLSYLKQNHLFLILLLFAVAINTLSAPVNSLMAPYLAEKFYSSSQALSIIGILQILGVLAGNYLYPAVVEKITERKLLLTGIIMTAVLYTGMLIFPHVQMGIFLYYALILIYCFVVGIFEVLLSSLFVRVVDKSYISRATGIFNGVCCAAAPVVALVVGVLLQAFSMQAILAASAVLAAGIGILLSRWQLCYRLNEKKKNDA